MSTHAPVGVDLQLVLDPSLRERLEKLAAAIGRDASELAGAVLRGFLDENERQMAAIDAGIEEADAGHLLDYEDVKADVLEKLSALAKR
jgi:predicted transcriptional regulator